MFTACNPFPGIFHITDEMGVSFTLVEGEDSALVFDAGYGTEDVASYLRTLTDKPFELILRSNLFRSKMAWKISDTKRLRTAQTCRKSRFLAA